MFQHAPSRASVAFRTVGCRLNQCETAQMQEALSAAGFSVVAWEEQADVRIVNTCTVTAKSDRTCRHEIHSAKRLDPDCLLAVAGCFAQVSPQAVASLPGVDLVLGNPDKKSLAKHVAAALQRPGRSTIAVSPYPERLAFETESFAHFHGRTRAFLKIQTGCDSLCSYCIVPLARGPARSMPQAAVLEQVRLLTSKGYREIVLTGVDLGSWGRDSREGRLAYLLDLLLKDGAGRDGPKLGRLRLSSVEPLEVDEALLDVVECAGDLMARHFHLPLQSGSDSVLERMGRPYSGARYLAIAAALARRMPDAALGADVIVGFPAETEKEFKETMDLVEASPLTYLHVFGYSDRPGTVATEMQPKIRPEVIKERSGRLRELGARKRAAFNDRLVGTEQRVLVLEERADDGGMVGLTGNYVEVIVQDDEILPNRFLRAILDQPLLDGRWRATLVERET